MRPIHSNHTRSQRAQSLRALVAAALGCGLAVTSASAQSMGGFGQRQINPNGVGQTPQSGVTINQPTVAQPPVVRQSAPAPQPAPAPIPAPVRIAPSPNYPRPTMGGVQSYGGGGNGQGNGGSAYNPPRRDGVPSGIYNSPRPVITAPVDGGGGGSTVGGGVTINNSNQGTQNVYRNGVVVRPGSGIVIEHPRPIVTGTGDSLSIDGHGRVNTVKPPTHITNYGSVIEARQPIRVTTPQGQQNWDRGHHHHDNFVYDNGGTTIITNGPVLLGGYYYGGYCNYGYGQNVYPSIYTIYGGFPQYICNPSVIVLGDPYYPTYTTGYLPFYQPTYQVTYNQTNYYTTTEEKASDISEGGEVAKKAVKAAYKDGTFQAAFADIANAWQDGNVASLRKHLRDDDTKISILLKRKYAYSIASGDFEQITRDAFDRLSTVSFKFTRLRKAKNGDVTAYGKHVYRVADDSATTGDAVKDSDTVPFDTSDEQPYDKSADPAPGEEKTVYVAYTLRHKDDLWYIVAVNSSSDPLVVDEDQAGSDQ